jgi:hypothetical protein
MTFLVAVWWIGAIGTSTYYWFARGRTEEFVVGRAKTFFAFFFWYLYLAFRGVSYYRTASRQVETSEAKKRILD